MQSDQQIDKDNANPSLAESAYLKLEEMIALAVLEPKVLYTEKELTEMIDSSRTPAREALLRLAQEGLVNVIQRRGVQISDVDHHTIQQLLETRRPLQMQAVKLAAYRSNDATRAQMAAFAMVLESYPETNPPNKAELLEIVRKAHYFVSHASGNIFISKTLEIVQSLSRRYWLYYLQPGDVTKSLALHAELLRSIEGGFEERSMSISDRQMDYLEEFSARSIRWGEGKSTTPT